MKARSRFLGKAANFPPAPHMLVPFVGMGPPPGLSPKTECPTSNAIKFAGRPDGEALPLPIAPLGFIPRCLQFKNVIQKFITVRPKCFYCEINR